MTTTGRWLVGVCLALGLLTVVLPAATGVPWASTWIVVSGVPVLQVIALVGLWALGLVSHTITLTAALPTLTHRRALTLSLTGSAVSNVLPLGGAAGIALNGRMAKQWGYGLDQFTAFTVITNVWDVLAKLTLPLAVVPFVVTGVAVGPLLGPALLASVGLAIACAAIVAVLSWPALAGRVGGGLERATHCVLRWARSSRQVRLRAALIDLQATWSDVVRGQWVRLSLGMVLYTSLLFALLWACLGVSGVVLAPGAVLAGFAVERLLTLAGLTPGGAGVVEVGLTGALIGLGAAAPNVVAGVLLYRALTYGLEIPVGGVALAVWLWLRRRATTTPGPATATTPATATATATARAEAAA